MKHTYFLTGYPGFLAARLTEQLILDHDDQIEHINLLVLPDLYEQATHKINQFATTHGLDPDRFTIVRGDITDTDLGMQEADSIRLRQTVTHVFHLAAIYDLAVPKQDAFLVNVHGTREVNNWVETIYHLQRYIYFSTAYVSGTREGKIYETELDQDQSFKNHYEKTKFDAELMVTSLIPRLPVTIIRPGIVMGHSKTGETIKFDGIYFFLNFLEKVRFLPLIPHLGAGKPEGNFVPEDYVLEATSFLAIDPIGEGKTYHLTDPHPYTMREIYTMLAQKYLDKTPRGKVPVSLAERALNIKSIRRFLHVEEEALDYFTYEASYDATQATQDLEGSGITCPCLKETLDPIIAFYRKHKDDESKRIEIH